MHYHVMVEHLNYFIFFISMANDSMEFLYSSLSMHGYFPEIDSKT